MAYKFGRINSQSTSKKATVKAWGEPFKVLDEPYLTEARVLGISASM